MTLVKVNCCFLFDEQYYIDSENFTVLFFYVFPDCSILKSALASSMNVA